MKELRKKVESVNGLKNTLDIEERKNTQLTRELDEVNQINRRLTTSIRDLEGQVESEQAAQRGFNLAERTQRIQNNYRSLRETMTSYASQLTNSLPLLFLLSNMTGNTTLGEILPVIMGTLGETDS